MATIVEEPRVAAQPARIDLPNGAAMAAFMAAGIGSFAMGLIMMLTESGLLSVPTLYEPAGGVTGRTTLAVIIWLVSWVGLHVRWREQNLGARRLPAIIAILIGLGILGTVPPVWGLL